VRYGRHPLYPAILAVPKGLIPDEISAAAGQGTYPSITPPLATRNVPEVDMGSVTLAAYIIPAAVNGVPEHPDIIKKALPEVVRNFPRGTPLTVNVRWKMYEIFEQYEEPNEAQGDAEYLIMELDELRWWRR
jgi:hypothetical protein